MRMLNRTQENIVFDVIELINERFNDNKIEHRIDYFMIQNVSDILKSCNLTGYDDDRISKFFKEFGNDLLPF
jgi:hypothetical protein